MPIYEYRCAECGCEKEYLQKVSEPLKTDCPECGKPALQKKLTAAGFQLKGSGWYVTDFRDGGKKADSKKSGANDNAAKPSESKAADSTASSGSGETAKSDTSSSASSSKTDSTSTKASSPTTTSGS